MFPKYRFTVRKSLDLRVLLLIGATLLVFALAIEAYLGFPPIKF